MRIFAGIGGFTRRNPVLSVLVLLGLLFALIVVGNKVRKPEELETTEPEAKLVSIYTVANSPTVLATAKVIESSVISVFAQTGGVVDGIYVEPGQKVKRGTRLAHFGSNYLGAQASSVQSAIAAESYKNAQDTYQTQKDIVNLSRELAGSSKDNANEQRRIADESIDTTREVVSLTQDVISQLEINLSALEASNIGGVNDQAIAEVKQALAATKGSLTQVNTGLSNAELAADDDKPPAKLNDQSYELTLKQLEIQDKAIDLGLEVSRLQLQLATISESLSNPASPVSGTVESVNIARNQLVSPGMLIATISGIAGDTVLSADIAYGLSELIDTTSVANVNTPNGVQKAEIRYSSEAPTNPGIATVSLLLLEPANFVNGEYVTVNLPMEFDTDGSIYVPLSAVHQTQKATVVYVVDGDIARSKNIELGKLAGAFVEVPELHFGEKVILSRNVIDGDKVRYE